MCIARHHVMLHVAAPCTACNGFPAWQITRSPIYSHFGESLAGMDTVRAYGYERRFALESDARVDYNNRCAGHCPLPALWFLLCGGGVPALVVGSVLTVCIHSSSPASRAS